MNMTLAFRIIFVFVVGLILSCIAMLIGFNMALGDALTGAATFKALLIGGGIIAILAVAGSFYICSRLCPIRKVVLYARAIAAGDAKAKLEMLQQYRDEYAARFRQAAQNGISPREWHNYQQFLNRLDDAIEVQRNTVATQARQTAAGQMQWQQQRKKLKAFDTLSDRHHAAENAKEAKREQKMQDEFATRDRGEKEV